MAALARQLDQGDDLTLSPLRVAWLAEERDGDRAVHLRDVLRGDPRKPSQRRKRALKKVGPGPFGGACGEIGHVSRGFSPARGTDRSLRPSGLSAACFLPTLVKSRPTSVAATRMSNLFL